MANSTTALMFVIFLNVLMFVSQISMDKIAEGEGTHFYNCSGRLIDSFGDCTQYTINTNPDEALPSSAGTVAPTTGNIFTDVFNNILSYLKNIPGVNFLYNIIKAPYSLMQSIGLPAEISFILGSLWYIISLFIVISFLWGRE